MSVVCQGAAMNRSSLSVPSEGFPRYGPVASEIPLTGFLRPPNGLSVDFVGFSPTSLPECVNKCCVIKYKSPLRNAINCYYIAWI